MSTDERGLQHKATELEGKQASGSRPRRGRRRRYVLYTGLLGLLVLLLLYVTRASTLNPMAVWAIERAAPRLSGFQVELEALETDWCTGARLRGLVVRPVDPPEVAKGAKVAASSESSGEAGGLRELRLQELTLEFAPFAFTRPLLVRAVHGRVDVALAAAGAEPEPTVAEPSSGLPDWLPLVELEEIDILLRLPAGDDERIELNGLQVASQRTDAGAIYTLELDSVVRSAASSEPTRIEGPLAARINYGPERVEIDQLAVGSGAVTGSGQFDFGQLEQGVIAWELDFEALETVFANRIELRGDGVARLDGLQGLAASLAVGVHGFSSGGRELDLLVIEGSIANGRVALEAGRLVLPGGELVVEAGSIELVVPKGEVRERQFELDLLTRFDDLGPLGKWLDLGIERPVPGVEPEAWTGRLSGDLHLRGTPSDFKGHAQWKGEDVGVFGAQLGAVELSASADGGVLEITGLTVHSESMDLDATGRWHLASERLESARLDARIAGLDQLTAGLVDPGGFLNVRAELDGPWDTPDGTVSVEGEGVVIAGESLTALRADATLQAGIAAIDQLVFAGRFGQVSAAVDATLPLRGRDLELHVRALTLRQDEHELTLAQPFELELQRALDEDGLPGEPGLRIPEMSLVGNAGELVLAAELSTIQSTARVRSTELNATPFLSPYVDGMVLSGLDLDLAFDLDGTSELDRALTARGQVDVARFVPSRGSTPLAATLTGELVQGVLTLDRFEVRAKDSGAALLDLSASLPFEPLAALLLPEGAVRVQGNVALPPEFAFALPLGDRTVAVSGEVTGRIDLEGTSSALRGSVKLSAREVILSPVATPYLVEPAGLQIDLRLGDEIEVVALEIDLPRRCSLSATGRIQHGADLNALLRPDYEGWLAAPIDLNGSFTLDELAWLAQLTESLRRIEGQAQGSIAWNGTLGDFAPKLELSLREGSLKSPGVPELTALEIDTRFEAGVLHVDRIQAEMGAAPIELSGTIDFGSSVPQMDLHADGKGVLLARSSTVRMRGDLDLNLSGPLDGLVLAGRVALRNSSLLQDIDLLAGLTARPSVRAARRGISLPTFTDGPLSTMRLDVDVETAEPLRVRSNLARGQANADLHVGGTGEVIVPTGRLFLENMRLDLPGGALTFPSGLVLFEQSDPRVPRIEMTGEARLAGYDVQLGFSGPYDDLEIVASSQPSLATDELYLLILTGRVPSRGDRTAAAAQSLGLFLAKDLLSRWASGGDDLDGSETILDRFEILTGRDVSKSGLMTMEVTYLLRRPEDDLGKSWYAVAERDKFEDINMGLRFVFRSK